MANNSDVALLTKIAGYAEILTKDPHSTVFVTLGDAYRQLGRLDEALEIVRKGVQGLPWFSPGHVVLGQILMARGETGEALGCFNKALTLDGESIAAFKGLAAIYCQNGQADLARQVLERADQIHPDNSSIQHMLNRLSAVAEESASAVADAPQADPKQTVEAPIATTTIAELFVKQGLLSQACQVYRDILQADPDNGPVRAKLIELGGRLTSNSQPEVIEAQASCAAPAAQAEPLATLQSWLTAARLRREHVQKHFAGHR
ncbi:MAG: tetratricopeptide repeat protein [Desulfuromonadaceae bacterium]|nr:tetratricopeptide repeat protein [Desulfuromonadaceae bacterium]